MKLDKTDKNAYNKSTEDSAISGLRSFWYFKKHRNFGREAVFLNLC